MPEWFETLDAEHLEHATAKGWNKPAADVVGSILQSHRALERMVGVPADQVLKLPKDASDPTYQAAFDRIVSMSVPQNADGYKIDGVKFKDGTDLSADDLAFVRTVAAKYKLPESAARGLAVELAARSDAFEASDAERVNLGRVANDTALTSAWGVDKSQKQFAASQAVDALKALGMHVADGAGMEPQAYVAHMNALVALAGQLSEHAILRGGGQPSDPTTGMTPQTARARFDELKANPEWIVKALTPGTSEADLLGKLQRAMVTAPRQ